MSNTESRNLKNRPAEKAYSGEQHAKVMVASQGKYTTEAAIKMIELGGNAFDALTALHSLYHERPHSTGGGGFMLIDGPAVKQATSYDLKKLLAANSKMYLNKMERKSKRSC